MARTVECPARGDHILTISSTGWSIAHKAEPGTALASGSIPPQGTQVIDHPLPELDALPEPDRERVGHSLRIEIGRVLNGITA